jgi:hypothetical protein
MRGNSASVSATTNNLPTILGVLADSVQAGFRGTCFPGPGDDPRRRSLVKFYCNGLSQVASDCQALSH